MYKQQNKQISAKYCASSDQKYKHIFESVLLENYWTTIISYKILQKKVFSERTYTNSRKYEFT